MTSALTLLLIQPWENSGLHVHLPAHLPHVPAKVMLPSKQPNNKRENWHPNYLLDQLKFYRDKQAQMQDLNSD